MMKKAIFRADGSYGMGLGHLVRCMALAHMLKNDFDIEFVSLEIPKGVVGEIIQQGFSFKKINLEKEFQFGLRGDEMVVLDHYYLDSTYQKNIKGTGCKLVCIDDMHDKEFFADLIINHSPGINIENYRAQPYTKFALGLNHALLRPAFLEAANQKRIIDKIETILISFGGTDPLQLTPKTVNTVIASKRFKEIIIIVGPAFKKSEQMNKLIESKQVMYFQNIDHFKLKELMMKTDLAIVPASGILIEALACGVIPITCFYVKNQINFHHNVTRLYNIKTIGLIDNSAEKKMKDILGMDFDMFKSNDRIKNIIKYSKSNILRAIKHLYNE